MRQLLHSQGYYGRLLERILCVKEYEPEAFEEFKMIVEEQHFKDPVDVVLFSNDGYGRRDLGSPFYISVCSYLRTGLFHCKLQFSQERRKENVLETI